MNCVYFKVRTKRYEKYFYCKKKKEQIEVEDCYSCANKEIKKYKATLKKNKSHKSSKMSKACEISKSVKQRVYTRDNESCIFCGKWVPESNACCHFVPRSKGGLGVEQNIFTACSDCHRAQDNGLQTKKYDDIAKTYLKKKYKDWNIKNLIFKKY